MQKNGDFNTVFVSLNMGSTTPDTDSSYMAGKLLEHKLTAAMVSGADAIAVGVQELDKPVMDADGIFNTMYVLEQPSFTLTAHNSHMRILVTEELALPSSHGLSHSPSTECSIAALAHVVQGNAATPQQVTAFRSKYDIVAKGNAGVSSAALTVGSADHFNSAPTAPSRRCRCCGTLVPCRS